MPMTLPTSDIRHYYLLEDKEDHLAELSRDFDVPLGHGFRIVLEAAVLDQGQQAEHEIVGKNNHARSDDHTGI
jgi:hypothetical protein